MSISSQNNDENYHEKTAITLISILNEIKKIKCKRKNDININKWLKRIASEVRRGFDSVREHVNDNIEAQISLLLPNPSKLNIYDVVKSLIKCKSIILSQTQKFIVSTSEMLSITIYLTLLKQNVESNPGMNTFTVTTYNCNGLGDRNKLKRLSLKIAPIVRKGGIVLLQETHLAETKYLSTIWKDKFESNCIRTNSAGVLTLYKNDYELIEMEKDQEGRFLILVLRNQDMKLIVSNAYFPNDHKLAITFAEALYLKILEYQHKYPDYLTIAAGDYNVCMKPEDSLNRNITKVETYLADSILNNNKITNLVDSYRNLHKVGGFTWKRGTCYSRLDYIFLSSSMLPSLKNVKQDWSFEESDHAAVQATLTETNITNKGPGIAKVNINILDNPIIVSQLEKDIQNMLEQMDNTWSPHDKLEFLKVVIRSVFSAKVAETRKSINLEIGELEDELNDFNALKLSILDEINVLSQDNPEGIEVVDNAITSLKCRLLQKRNNLSTYLAFRSKVKWFEYGEKPNKFFLNLTKSKQSQKLITKISNNGKIAVGQEEVTKEITNFYKNLYKASPRENIVDDNFYDNCPKLSAEQAETLDKDLTLLELSKALNSSKDSAPGPDGIPYQVYKKFWKIAGPIILDSWIYSIKTKTMPPSHYESMITLLPKDGKDPTDIKNWRPITLSNCDAKIITKALANKTSKVLESIIDKAQTAYVPGRSVADNLRSNFFLKTYCKQNNIESVLVSLDAKKAFNSVDHRYIEETLRAYGFGEGFIGTFKLLYYSQNLG